MAELTREKEEQDGRYKKAVRRLRQDLANEKSEIEKRAELRVKESQLDVLEKEKRLAQSAKKSRALEREMERLKAEVVKVGDLTTHEATLKSQALLSQMRDSMLEHAKRTKVRGGWLVERAGHSSLTLAPRSSSTTKPSARTGRQ